MPAGRFPVVLIGAYPSALHVRWTPPQGFGKVVAALPVDNEPSPFWNGDGADAAFAQWHGEHFQPEWGMAEPAALNGSSGWNIERDWLRPVGFGRDETFITDCLTTARASNGVALRLVDRYAPVAEALGAPTVTLLRHPSESEIVSEALDRERGRLVQQISTAEPEVIVTLGNAAARVLAELGGYPSEARLRPQTYGEDRRLRIDGRSYRWHALVHPATPQVWRERHQSWQQEAR